MTTQTQVQQRQSRMRLAGATLLTAMALAALTALLASAQAQEAPAAPAASAEAAPAPAPARRQVGDATRELFEKQRSGSLASTTPRNIAGDVAQRNYDRYLRSFEHPIPESFVTTVKTDSKSSAK